MALFQKKLDRSMEIMRERNRKYLAEYEEKHGENEDPAIERGQNYVFRTDSYRDPEDGLPEEEETEFEKGDLFAIIVSALMVFWPIFLILGLILVLAFRALIH